MPCQYNIVQVIRLKNHRMKDADASCVPLTDADMLPQI
jgi:hypothetical protein